jgi:hypothetical protein
MKPKRTVHHGEALAWLAAHAAAAGSSVVTSLPDVSELPELDFDAWQRWFSTAVQAVLAWVPADGVAIFYQTDVLRRGAWVDKSFLVQSAASPSGRSLGWHKIVCTTPPGSVSVGRAGYSHLLCFTHGPEPAFRDPTPDVLPAGGTKASQKAMGVEACLFACRHVRGATSARLIVDPFCGRGTVLAAANALGIDALGIDRSARACRAARALTLESERA